MKKGFTLIELLAVIVILAIIALIVTPVVSNIVANARIAANARSVEGHIRNIELAIISEAFIGSSTGDMDSYDTLSSGTEIEGRLSIPNNDVVTCSSYIIKHGTVLNAAGCKDSENKWGKVYTYSNSEGAAVFEFKGTVIWPGLDSNGNPTQDKISNTISIPMTDSNGDKNVTYLGIVYMDPTNLKMVCNVNNTNVSGTANKANCKKFYIYKDTGAAYKMIMDRNTTATISWVSEDDYKEYSTSDEIGLTEKEANSGWNTNKVMYGPVTAYKQLKLDTAGWIGNPDLIDADDVAEFTGAALQTTIAWSSAKDYLYNPNDITTQSSYYKLDGGRNEDPTSYSATNGWKKRPDGKSKYYWLINYSGNCSLNGGCYMNDNNTTGYWTKNKVTYSSNALAWIIDKYSSVSTETVSNSSSYGIRPVLEVPKSLIG